MASPALYWTTRTVSLAQKDILVFAKQIMAASGLTAIKVSSIETSGRTPSVTAAICPKIKSNPPSSGSGLGTTGVAPTCITFFVAAGSGAKGVLEKLLAAWDDLDFL